MQLLTFTEPDELCYVSIKLNLFDDSQPSMSVIHACIWQIAAFWSTALQLTYVCKSYTMMQCKGHYVGSIQYEQQRTQYWTLPDATYKLYQWRGGTTKTIACVWSVTKKVSHFSTCPLSLYDISSRRNNISKLTVSKAAVGPATLFLVNRRRPVYLTALSGWLFLLSLQPCKPIAWAASNQTLECLHLCSNDPFNDLRHESEVWFWPVTFHIINIKSSFLQYWRDDCNLLADRKIAISHRRVIYTWL